MKGQLEKEFRYYLEHQEELVRQYDGKVLVIHAQSVAGAFDTEWEALQDARAKFEPGTFIIQRCSPGADDYTQTFTSRVCFAS
jgi:hypothetical protein